MFMAGMASIVFALCFWLVDGVGVRRWTRPFVIFGMNAIAIYMFSGLFARLMVLIRVGPVSLHSWVFTHAFAPLAAPADASLLYALANVAIMFLIAWGMYRRNWFVKF